MGYYSITGSVVAYLFWYQGISMVRANIAGLFTGLIPVSSALIAILFLNERFTLFHAMGMALVLLAIRQGAKHR
jgi:drug/metabolite transporter (DMT)-like permease